MSTPIDFHERPAAGTIDRPSAVNILEAKTRALIADASTTFVDDNRVLKVSVPQCEDWLSAWPESTEQNLSASKIDCLRTETATNPDLT